MNTPRQRLMVLISLLLFVPLELADGQVVTPAQPSPSRPTAPWRTILARHAAVGLPTASSSRPPSCVVPVEGPDSFAVVPVAVWLADVWIVSQGYFGTDWNPLYPEGPSDTLKAVLANASCSSSLLEPALILRAGQHYVLIEGLTETPSDGERWYPDSDDVLRHPLRIVTMEGGLDPVILHHKCADAESCAWRLRGYTEYVDSLQKKWRMDDSIQAIVAAGEHAAAERERSARIRAHKWSPAITRAVLKGQVGIGMTAEMVKEAFGSPIAINRTTTGTSIREQWVYGAGQYVYFQNGRVTAIDQRINAPK